MHMNTSGQKPKIALVVTQGVWGGAQQYVHDLARQLQKDHDILVISGPGGDLRNKLFQGHLRHISVGSLVRSINPFKELKALVELIRIFRAERPDIVHLNSSKAGVLGAVAAKLAGDSKVVFTVHGLVLNEPLPFYKKCIYWAAEKFASFFRDATITVSNQDRRSVIKYHLSRPEHVYTIYNGINAENIELFEPMQARKKLAELCEGKIDQTTPLVGTIADFYPTKDYPNLISAAVDVIKQRPDVRFLAFGRGEAARIKELIKKTGLENKFFLLIGNNEACRYLSGFNVFTLASKKEGLPYTILEAMISGTMIAATTAGGIPELVEHKKSALLAKPSDSQSLARNILHLLDSPEESKKLAEEAKSKSKQFSMQRMLVETKKVYQSLLVD